MVDLSGIAHIPVDHHHQASEVYTSADLPLVHNNAPTEQGQCQSKGLSHTNALYEYAFQKRQATNRDKAQHQNSLFSLFYYIFAIYAAVFIADFICFCAYIRLFFFPTEPLCCCTGHLISPWG